jgi:hypothetical protein
MPWTECANEGRHHGIRCDAELPPQDQAIAGREARGIKDRRIDAVRIADDAFV